MDVIILKKISMLMVLALLLGILVACGHSEVEPTIVPTEPVPVTETPTEAPTEIPTETPTEAPTEPPEAVARELIREGKYEEALAQLENVGSEEAELLRLRAGLGDVAEGDEVIFGCYEQDNDLENGAEEVSWIVLKVEDNHAWLLSRDCLDTLPYYDVFDGRSDWEHCTLRTWLNEDFLNAAFDATEQKLLLETELVNKDNPAYHTPGGENTVDRVFLLSLDDAYTYEGTSLMIAKVSPYAENKGCYANAGKAGWWWLRSPGKYTRDACYVDAVGKPSHYGYVLHRDGWAVRPAIWIDLNV